MQLGMIGLGRMGGNMVIRLTRAGHDCVVHDSHQEAVDALVAKGAKGTTDLAAFVEALGKPRLVWLMVPAAVVDPVLASLVPLLAPGDIVVDGGNSYYAAALRTSPDLAEFDGRVSDSGEGRWTLRAAIDQGVPAPVIATALFSRFDSRGKADYADRLLSALRFGFGGHVEKPKEQD